MPLKNQQGHAGGPPGTVWGCALKRRNWQKIVPLLHQWKMGIISKPFHVTDGDFFLQEIQALDTGPS